MTCCALCVVRVQRGLRGAAVMCSLATARLFARALRVRCSAAARAARAAWRCKLRVDTANCIAGGCNGCIIAAEQRFCNRFQQRAVRPVHRCCTRARGGRGLRDAELHRLTNERLGCQSDARKCAGSNSPLVAFIRSKADTGPEGGIPQIAGTRSSQRIDRALFAAEQRRSGHTQRAFSVRTAATSYDERSRCCPGRTVIRTRRGLPNTAHKKRPLRTTPPRPW